MVHDAVTGEETNTQFQRAKRRAHRREPQRKSNRGRTAEPPRTGRARHHWERDTVAQRKAAQDTNRRAEDTDERRSRTVTRRPSTAERPPARPADVGTAAGFGLWGRFPRTYGLSIW